MPEETVNKEVVEVAETAQHTLERIHKAARSERRGQWMASTLAYTFSFIALVFMGAHIQILERWLAAHRAYIKERDIRWEQRFDIRDRNVGRIIQGLSNVVEKVESLERAIRKQK